MQTQKQNVSRLEKAQFDPKLGTLLKYAEAVGMRITLDFPLNLELYRAYEYSAEQFNC
ncbi:hypothetical protein J4731_22215 [Providencia rettgeri]|nr:hypothetical protein [Providencia rettgeri]